MPREPRKYRDQRRLIDITPGQVPPTRNVIKFIAEKSVVVDSRQVNCDFAKREAREQRPSHKRCALRSRS